MRGAELEPAGGVVVPGGGDDPEPDLHERGEEGKPRGRLAREREDGDDERGDEREDDERRCEH